MTVKHQSFNRSFKTVMGTRYYEDHPDVLAPPYNLQPYTFDVTITNDAVGANLPNWRKIIQSGGSATNDFVKYGRQASRAEQIPALISSVWRSSGYRLDTLGAVQVGVPEQPNLFDFKPDLRQDLLDEVNMKILGKIAEAHNPFNAYAFLGELRETIHTIRHPGESIAQLMTTYAERVADNKRQFTAKRHWQTRKGRLSRTVKQRIHNDRKLKRLLQQERRIASNLWLEYRFGVLPLISDLKALASNALDSLLGNTQDNFRWYKASAKGDAPGLAFSPEYGDIGFCRYLFSNSQVHRGKATLLARERIEIRGPAKGLLDVINYSVDLGNLMETFIPALWDLTPLSVFVDYFVNINDVLTSSLLDLRSIDHVELQYRESKDTTAVATCIGQSTSGVTINYATDGTNKVSNYRYQRKEWQLTIPSIRFTLPIGKPIRLANLAAFLNNIV